MELSLSQVFKKYFLKTLLYTSHFFVGVSSLFSTICRCVSLYVYFFESSRKKLHTDMTEINIYNTFYSIKRKRSFRIEDTSLRLLTDDH